MSPLLLALLLGAAPQDDLPTVVDRLEAHRRELKDFRAEWRFLECGRPADRLKSSGRILLRAPGDVAWTATADRGILVRAASATGIRGSLRGDSLVVHAPWNLEPVGRQAERHPHHGAEWFTGNPAKDTPAIFPVFALYPWDFPAFALLDLAPRRFLSMLPGLWVLGRFKEGEKEYLVLKAQPPARNLRDEDQRAWGESWTEVKIWIDPADFRLARVAVRSDCDAVGPTEHEWVCDYTRRDADGIPVEMTVRFNVPKRPTLGSSWRLELRDAKVNAGVKAEEVELPVPADRIARDWLLQPEAVYEERLKRDPKDASAWLNLGSLRLQRYQGDLAEPFRNVIDLRPEAAEGYVGMLFALERTKASPLPVLEQAARAGVKSAQVHVDLAHRHVALGNTEAARRHFAEALRLGGDVPEVLVAASRLGDADRLLLRALKAEGKREVFAYGPWKALKPSGEAQLELYRHYDTIGGASAKVQARMMDLAASLGQPGDASRHAGAVVELLAKDIRPDDDYAVLRTLEFFLDAQDFDSAWKLQRAVAAWTDEKWSMRAGSMECRLHVARDTLEELLLYFDERFPPKQGNSLAFSPVRVSSLTHAIKEAKKVDLVIEALLATPGDHPKRAWRGELLELLVNEHTSGSRQRELAIKAGEMRKGEAGRPEEFLQLARTLTHEKKWKEARAKAGEVLAKATAAQHRFDAERVIAECFLAEGDRAGAVAACDRALKEEAKYYREYAYLLRARALDPAGAAQTYAAAFEDPASRTWTLFTEVPKEAKSWPEILAWAEKGEARAGRLAVLAFARSATGDAAGAAAAMEQAADLRKGDLAFVRARLRFRAAALRIAEALADRTLLGETDLLEVNKELLAACERVTDLAVVKEFARLLGADYWSPKRCDSMTLSRVLQLIPEEAFFNELEKSLLSSSDKEYAPILVTQLLVWAWDGLGWHDKALARCRAVLADPQAAKNHEMMRSWIGSLERNKREYVDPLEALVARARENPGGDPIQTLERALASERSADRLRRLDRLWRGAIREGKAKPIHYQVGVFRGEPAERQGLIEELLERHPDQAEWRIKLALIHLQGGKADLAVQAILAAMRKVPASHPSWGSLEGRLKDLTPGQVKAVAPAFEEMGIYPIAWELASGPLDDRLRLAQKWQAAAKGEEQKARAALAASGVLEELKRPADALDALAEIGDPLPEIRLRRSRLRDLEWRRLNDLAQGGDRKELARALHRAVRRKGVGANEAEGYVYVVMARGGKVLEFIMAWEEATALEPPAVGATLFLARLQGLAGQWTEVVRVLGEGRRAFPDEPAFDLPLGRAAVAMGDFRGAAEVFERVLARDAESFEARMSLVRCYGKIGRLEAAAEHLRALEARKGIRGTLAGLAAEAGLHGEAARLFRGALEEEPPRSAAPLRFGLARALRDSGKPREAEAEFRVLVRDHPEFSAAAAPELFELLPAEGRGRSIAEILLGSLRAARTDRDRRGTLVTLAITVPAKDRASVLEAWETLATKDVVEQVASISLILTWGGTPEKALERLRAVEARAPDSVWVYLEYERLLQGSSDGAEQARVQERLADVDPKGEVGSLPALVRRLAALRLYVQLQKFDDILRGGLRVLFDPGKTEPQAQEARRALAVAAGQLDEKGWLKLKKLALPAPDPKLAERARGLVAQLSDEEFEKRTAARRELHTIGAPALGLLLPLVDSDDLDLRQHARGAVEDILTR